MAEDQQSSLNSPKATDLRGALNGRPVVLSPQAVAPLDVAAAMPRCSGPSRNSDAPCMWGGRTCPTGRPFCAA